MCIAVYLGPVLAAFGLFLGDGEKISPLCPRKWLIMLMKSMIWAMVEKKTPTTRVFEKTRVVETYFLVYAHKDMKVV